MPTIPEGLPFSRAYRTSDRLSSDSEKFRVRLRAYVEGLEGKNCQAICEKLELSGGFKLDRARTSYSWKLVGFLERSEINDVLDAITYIYQALAWLTSGGSTGADGIRPNESQRKWRTFVSEVFVEESLAYRLDGGCAVRHYVDEQFERGRVVAVAELGDPALDSVRALCEASFEYLLATKSQDTKASVRAMFEAVEVMTKVIVPDAPRLAKNWVKGKLKDAYLQGVDRSSAEHTVVTKLFDSLGEWVDALHVYRHGHNEPVPVAPTEETAIYALSTGAAHLRWLAPRAKQLAAARA